MFSEGQAVIFELTWSYEFLLSDCLRSHGVSTLWKLLSSRSTSLRRVQLYLYVIVFAMETPWHLRELRAISMGTQQITTDCVRPATSMYAHGDSVAFVAMTTLRRSKCPLAKRFILCMLKMCFLRSERVLQRWKRTYCVHTGSTMASWISPRRCESDFGFKSGHN